MNQNVQNLIFQAQQAHINGFLDQAITLYTQILNIQTNFGILINRAKAFIDMHNITYALKDCEQIIKGSSNKYNGYYYRGICQFYQGAFEQAIIDFNEALKKLETDDDKEMQNLVQKQIQCWLTKVLTEQKDNKQFKQQQQPMELEEHKQQNNQQQQQQPQQNLVFQQVLSLGGKLKYTWAQDNTSVIVQLNQKVQNEKDIKAQFETKSIEVSFPLSGSSNYDFSVDLLGEIIPQESYVKAKANLVEIVLKKKNLNDHWLNLEVQTDME